MPHHKSVCNDEQSDCLRFSFLWFWKNSPNAASPGRAANPGHSLNVVFKTLHVLREVITDEPSATIPVLRIQEHISAQIDEQVVDVPATTSQEDIAESLRLNVSSIASMNKSCPRL